MLRTAEEQKALLDAIREGFRIMRETYILCRDCNGLGFIDGDVDNMGYPYTCKCIACKGAGKLPIQRDLFN